MITACPHWACEVSQWLQQKETGDSAEATQRTQLPEVGHSNNANSSSSSTRGSQVWLQPVVQVWKKTTIQNSGVWISCNFYCTFLFGLANDLSALELFRPSSSTEHSGREWDKVARSDWSRVRGARSLLRAQGGHTDPRSVTGENFGPDLRVHRITRKPICLERPGGGLHGRD